MVGPRLDLNLGVKISEGGIGQSPESSFCASSHVTTYLPYPENFRLLLWRHVYKNLGLHWQNKVVFKSPHSGTDILVPHSALSFTDWCPSRGPPSLGACPLWLGVWEQKGCLMVNDHWESLVVTHCRGGGATGRGHMAQGRRQRPEKPMKIIHSFNIRFLRAHYVSGIILGSRPVLPSRNWMGAP